MIKRLRKRHLQIWVAWAVLLPVGIITAYTSIQKPATEKLLQPAPGISLPVSIKTVEKETYKVSLRSNADTSKLQLDWVNKILLSVPTATIYQLRQGDSIREGKLIGRIEARGNYRFVVDTGFLKAGRTLILYDFIHKQIIDTIQL